MRLNPKVCTCVIVSPTVIPVAVPVIVVTTATQLTCTFHALLLPEGMIKLVTPVPSKDNTVVAAVVKAAERLAVNNDC